MAGLYRHNSAGRMGVGEETPLCVAIPGASRILAWSSVREIASHTTANLGAHPGAGKSFK
jgi:hypothetical protein